MASPFAATPNPTTPIDGSALVSEGASKAASISSITTTDVDVVVVGGGFSGLIAAYDLQQAGFKTVLLEAKNRIGGRSNSVALKSGPGIVELGATWINRTTQPSVYTLAQKFGLQTAEQYTTGLEVFQGLDGQVSKVEDLGTRLQTNPQDHAAVKIAEMMAVLEQAIQKTNIRKWDTFPLMEDISLEEWAIKLDLYNDISIRAQCSHMTTAIVGREPHEVGAHYFFDYVKSAGGIASISSEGEFGAQSLKVKKGTSSIATALRDAMDNGSVKIQAPVESITQYGQIATVTTKTGQTFTSKKVILAIPTNTYGEINFSPPLPQQKRALVSRTKPGIYAKVILTYSSAWWRDAGMVGKFTSMLGPICFSWDISDESTSQYSLAIFIAGKRAEKWHVLSPLAREEAVIEHLVDLVGPQMATKARDVLEVNAKEWTKEEYIWGAPTSVMGPGLLRKYGQELRQPYRNLHFAGGELAYEWKGYLEGAITSGQRAAAEVIQVLQPVKSVGV